MKKIQETLTHESFRKNDETFIRVPAVGLINPNFMLKKSELYVFLYDYSQAFIVKDLSLEDCKAIIDGTAYLVESIPYLPENKHKIRLGP